MCDVEVIHEISLILNLLDHVNSKYLENSVLLEANTPTLATI